MAYVDGNRIQLVYRRKAQKGEVFVLPFEFAAFENKLFFLSCCLLGSLERVDLQVFRLYFNLNMGCKVADS